VGPRTVLDTVVKRKIPSPRRESKPRTPILQPVAQRYTYWAITAVPYLIEIQLSTFGYETRMWMDRQADRISSWVHFMNFVQMNTNNRPQLKSAKARPYIKTYLKCCPIKLHKFHSEISSFST
jgi:hypothetical protein